MSVHLSETGLAEMVNALETIPETLRSRSRILTMSAQHSFADMVSRIPVRTGRLRASATLYSHWDGSKFEVTFAVGDGLNYADIVLARGGRDDFFVNLPDYEDELDHLSDDALGW